MTDPKQLPHLIKLLDDDSADVRQSISLTLQSYGPALQEEIRKLNVLLTPLQRASLDCIYFKHKVNKLIDLWPQWFKIEDEYEKLETALSLIADFMENIDGRTGLKDTLDDLALSYKERYHEISPFLLAKFLFTEVGLRGDEEDYYNPHNSSLTYVIREKKGIPISLSSVYMLVGWRLGLEIEGCHFPGHFLSRVNVNNNLVFIDCFSSGQIIHQEDIIRVQDSRLQGIEDILHEEVSAQIMIRRFLANIIRAYQLQEEDNFSSAMIDLFKQLDFMLIDSDLAQISPESIIMREAMAFKSGQVVRHKKYGYRGVIVDFDDFCQSSDDWYYGNQTQPDRSQPWYHILVDGTDQVTYVAQSNLKNEESFEKIEHPLLSYFFTEGKKGNYIRNGNPWPETDF